MMRGEYDNILMWPFKGTVKVTLIGTYHNNEETVNFNDNRKLERVTEGTVSENGYGNQQWVLHSSLEKFLIDDTLHIKISEISVLLSKN